MAGNVQTFKSKTFTTEAFRAVFPALNEPDRFGNYKLNMDCLEHPDMEETILEQARETLEAGQAALESNKQPTNEIVSSGTHAEHGPFRRIAFKMKGTRTGKDGTPIPQKPQVVDAGKTPMTEAIWGGSLVKVAYFIQYTLMPTGTYLSVKLAAVQVIKHVGPGSGVDVDDAFGEEEGFRTSGEEPGVDVDETPAVSTPDADTAAPAASARNF